MYLQSLLSGHEGHEASPRLMNKGVSSLFQEVYLQGQRGLGMCHIAFLSSWILSKERLDGMIKICFRTATWNGTVVRLISLSDRVLRLPSHYIYYVSALIEAFTPPAQLFTCCDFFAGRCAISRAFKARGYPSCALDIILDERDES